jgi:ATP-binding cassette, subfamily B, bacterial
VSTAGLLWRIVRLRPWFYAVLLVSETTFLVGRLVPGYLERAIFDRLTGQAAGLNAFTLIAIMVSAELGRLVMSLTWNVSEAVVQYHGAAVLQRTMMRRVLARPGAAQQLSPGEMVSRFRDDVEDTVVFSTVPVTLFGTFAFSVVALVLMVRINAQLTGLVVLPLLLVIAVAALANNRVRRYRVSSRSATASVTGFLGEVFGSVQAIKLVGAERNVGDRFRELNDARRRASVSDAVFTQLLNSIFYNGVDIGIGLVLLLAAHEMANGSFTIGDFALFDYYLYFVTRLPLSIGQTLVGYRQAAVAAGRVAAATDSGSPLELDTRDAPLRPAPPARAERLARLETASLTYLHPGSRRGIEDVSIALEGGSFTVVTGRVGSGKTTLLRALLGLLPPGSGVVRWNGREVEDPASFFVPPRCAYVPQVPHLFSETLRDNVLLGLDEEGVDLRRAIRTAALDRDVERLGDGLDTLVGSRGVRLSGGQVQRTALARAFVRDPALTVIDDLASAVDRATEQTLLERLDERRGTLLVTSHRPRVLAQADQVIVLEAGRVHACGRLEELLETSAVMQQLWLELEDGRPPGGGT